MKTLMVNVPEAIYFKDLESRFIRINNAQANKFGFPDPFSIVGKSDFDFFTEENARMKYDDEQLVIKTEQPVNKEENEVWVDGTERWILTTKMPLRDAEGNIIGTFGISKDITERKLMEEALRVKTMFLEALLNSSIDGIMVVNSQLKKILQNQRAVEIWKIPQDIVDLKNNEAQMQHDISMTKDPEQFLEKVGYLIEHPYETIRDELELKDGAILDRYSAPVIGENGQYYGRIWTFRDITERKRAETVMVHQEFLMRSMMENVTDYIYFKNRESRFIRISKSLAEKYRIADPSEAIGQSDFDYFKKESAQQKFEDEQTIIRTGKPISKEEWEMLGETTELWVSSTKMPLLDAEGNIIGTFGISKDITEHKHAEEALRLKTMFLEAVTNTSIDGILVVNSYGEKILQNQRTVDLWKIPQHIIDDPDGMNQVHHVMRMTKNPEQFVKEIEHQREHPDEISKDELELIDGTVLERYSTPVLGSDGKNYGRIYVCHDVTERKKAEDQIKNLLAEKELLLREVHHRIKNNMNTLNSLISLQAMELKEPSAINALKEASHRILSMMLLYDRLYQAADFNAMSIQNYVPHLVDGIIANFPACASVKVVKKIEDFVLDAKILQPLGIIINELITNTMKYAFPDRSDGLITISVSLKDNVVSLVIADNGKGMPESIDFEKTTSFGLMLVRLMAMQLNGVIKLERRNGIKYILEFSK